MTFADLVSSARDLSPPDKVKLIRILAEELDTDSEAYGLFRDKVYGLPTPYGAFGAAKILQKAISQPLDEWEALVLGVGQDCGVLLCHEALSREELYDE